MTFSTLTLLILMTGIGLILEHSFYLNQMNAMQERLKLHSYSILSVAEYQQQQLFLPVYLQERRFNRAESGLYAQVVSQDFRAVWSSLSARQLPVASNNWAEQGQWMYAMVQREDEHFLLARFGVSWSESGKPGPVFNILLLENMQELKLQTSDYRQKLLVLLLGLVAFILLVQYLILRWGLRPLTIVSEELENIRDGHQSQLEGNYPAELKPLTSNLNHLIHSERGQRERYRNTMADLSHSLKTPLTVMSGVVRELIAKVAGNSEDFNNLQSQIDKMNSTIGYQLKRAVSGTQGLSIQRIAVFPLICSICDAMDKVYADKGMEIHLDIDEQLEFSGDENDLLEVMGNLIDNACKYGKQTVEVSAEIQDQALVLNIADDGPGIAEDKLDVILQRGQRLDTVQSGQGLGLALVKEILDGYQARLTVEKSASGGACFRIRIPQAAE